MKMNWDSPVYLADNGNIRGPLTLRLVRQLREQGSISDETLFCRKSEEEWLLWPDLRERVTADFPEFGGSNFAEIPSQQSWSPPPVFPTDEIEEPEDEMEPSPWHSMFHSTLGYIVSGATGLFFFVASLVIVAVFVQQVDGGLSGGASGENPFIVSAEPWNETGLVWVLAIACRSERPISITGISVNGRRIPSDKITTLAQGRDMASLMMGLPDMKFLKVPYKMQIGQQINVEVPQGTGQIIHCQIHTDRGTFKYFFQ